MNPTPPSATTETAAGDRLQANPVADPQDPLPESKWAPRRWSSFAVCAVGAFLLLLVIRFLWLISKAHTEEAIALAVIDGLVRIAGSLVLVIVFDRILLMVAPSAEQVIKMFATAGMLIRGVQIKTETETRATPGSATSTTTTTTRAPDPQIDTSSAGPND